MNSSLSALSLVIKKKDLSLTQQLLAVFMGVSLISVLAQVSVPLPWTPVPITGQTFAVALIALNFGRKWGFVTVLSYLLLGSLGLPIFAGARAGFEFGPTLGYLVGMLGATYVMGTLADLGWVKNWWSAYAACVLGSIITFSFGLAVLSVFVPSEMLLQSGLYPFLPGDLIKSLTAAGLSSSIYRLSSR